MLESQVRSVGSSKDFVSPPSMPYRKHLQQPSLEKAKIEQERAFAQVKDMSEAERWQYAETKLRELESIKESYI